MQAYSLQWCRYFWRILTINFKTLFLQNSFRWLLLNTFHFQRIKNLFDHILGRVSHKQLSGGGSSAFLIGVDFWCWRGEGRKQIYNRLAHSCAPNSHLHWQDEGNSFKPQHKRVLSGHWLVLWKDCRIEIM